MIRFISPCLCSLFLNFSFSSNGFLGIILLFLIYYFYIFYIISFCIWFFVIPINCLISVLYALPLDACSLSLNLVFFSSVTYVYSTQFLLLSNWSLGCRSSKQVYSDWIKLNWIELNRITTTYIFFNSFGVITQHTNVTTLILVVRLVNQFFSKFPHTKLRWMWNSNGGHLSNTYGFSTSH
jgi:hypothetical protein